MTSKVIVLAGTAGTGKSSVGDMLMEQHIKNYPDMEFLEGDTLHPPANVRKMQEGIPLHDGDRWDWLKKVSQLSSESAKKHGGLCVVTCSSLKKSYRDLIRETSPDTTFYFVFLYGNKHEILQRLEKRRGHFMKANMMESQFNDLELPNQESEPHCRIVTIDNRSFQQVEDDVKEKLHEMCQEL